MKVAGYMRVSTDHQNNENQRMRLEEYCNRRGWDLIDIYEDEESGSKRNRPGLDKMLKDARSYNFDKVLAVKVDRIARSLSDLLEISGKLGDSAVSLSFTDQDLDISSSQGRLMFQILGAFAEYEREIIIERTKAGQKRARKQGKKIGRPKLNGMTKIKIIRLSQEGESIRRIAEWCKVSVGTVHKVLKEYRGVSPVQDDDVHKTEVI
jgi:DNA invertase Pin-like site-specific DNA recombinase